MTYLPHTRYAPRRRLGSVPGPGGTATVLLGGAVVLVAGASLWYLAKIFWGDYGTGRKY